MDVIDELLKALDLPELEALLTPIPTTDADLIPRLAKTLTDACGDTNPDVPARLQQMLSEMFNKVSADVRSGSVAAALLDARPGMTHAQLINHIAAELDGVGLLRRSTMATASAPDILKYYQDNGQPWGLPDDTIPDDPFGLGDGSSFLDPAPVDVAASAGADWPTLQGLKDQARSIYNMWKQAPEPKSTKEDGPIVHLILQMQYAEWALEQEPDPHIVFLDNMFAQFPPKMGALLDPFDIKEWAKGLARLAELDAESPGWEPEMEKIQTALGEGKATPQEWPRPDILDLTSHELYEIKPIGSMPQGLRDVFYYLCLLNSIEFSMTVIKSVLTWVLGKGFNGGLPAPPNFWMPGIHWSPKFPVVPLLDGRFLVALTCAPGLVLYEIFQSDNAEEVEQEALAASKAFAASLLVKRLLQLAGKSASDAAGEAADSLTMSPQTQQVVQTMSRILAEVVMVGFLLLAAALVLA